MRYASALFFSIFKLRAELVELKSETARLSRSLVLGNDSVSRSLVELFAYCVESFRSCCLVAGGESCFVLFDSRFENGLLYLVTHSFGLDDLNALLS